VVDDLAVTHLGAWPGLALKGHAAGASASPRPACRDATSPARAEQDGANGRGGSGESRAIAPDLGHLSAVSANETARARA
jgi:hypothetical protein